MQSDANGIDNAEDVNITIPENLDIPDYIPMLIDFVKNFEKISRHQTKLKLTIQDLIEDLTHKTDDYLDFIFEDSLLELELDSTFFDRNLSSLDELIRAEYELKIWNDCLKESSSRIRQELDNEPEFSLDSLEYYQTQDKIKISDQVANEYQLYKSIHEELNSWNTVLSSNDNYRYLKNVGFILQHPEDPLPDEVEEEDLTVAGGKISLKDPISMNYFETPSISQRCSHVYEQATILDYLNNKSYCPVDGCNATISINDLKPDKIMKLRVKAFLRLENLKKKRKARSDFERL